MNSLERIFERLIWQSRFLVVFAVIASIAVAVMVFFIATVDVVSFISGAFQFAGLPYEQRDATRMQLIASVVKIIDIYLLGVVMLIFGLGLYELFVSKINEAEGSEFADRLLLIRSIDDLKSRLANVVLLMLVVKFFQEALQLSYQTPLELLSLAGGVLLLAGGLYLSHLKTPSKH
jgi:uncharacterized membrane protein YqhA